MGHRESANEFARKESQSRREIGDIPPVMNPERRKAAEDSLEVFCKEYQPGIFTRPFAPVHLGVISRIEEAMNIGGLFAYAMPRGTGKTTIAEAGVVHGLLTGRRRYVALISATEKHAQQSLSNIKMELGTNELIYEDWPEVVHAIWKLEGIAHRAGGQLYHGEQTHIVWKGAQLIFPFIRGSKASGSVVEVRGITSGAIRGMKANLPAGHGTIRPELIIIDDPQTDESAKSETQTNDREETILGTILGLRGHESEISVMMPCTVIYKDDLAERFLDVKKHPEWHGVKTSLIVKMPKATDLWDTHSDLVKSNRDAGHQFYLDNREAMDEDAEVLWPECFQSKSQSSALEYAMELKATVGERAFWSEYQNQPLADDPGCDIVSAEDVRKKTTIFAHRQVPPNCQHVTAFIDVHKELLYYVVAAWEENFNGFIIDYSVWPETKRQHFTLRDVHSTLSKKYLGMGTDGAIYSGLRDLTERLLNRDWGDNHLRIERCVIDANWKTTLVKAFCRESKHVTVLLPGHGRYIGADRIPINELKRAAGDRIGNYWKIPAAISRGGSRHVLYDTNYWKSFINTALLAPPGERGCLQLFAGKHEMFAEHLTSEYYVVVTGRGRVVQHWQLYPGREDNHWLDCTVGAAMAACMQGCKTIDTRVIKRTRRPVRYMGI